MKGGLGPAGRLSILTFNLGERITRSFGLNDFLAGSLFRLRAIDLQVADS